LLSVSIRTASVLCRFFPLVLDDLRGKATIVESLSASFFADLALFDHSDLL